MNIQELGSLGEFVGAIAVIVTLIYLAIQTRLTRKAAEETARFAGVEASGAVVAMYSRWRHALILNPKLASIFVKARGSETLTDEEQVLFSAAFDDLFCAAAFGFLSSAKTASMHMESGDTIHLMAVFKENPRAIFEWQRAKPFVTEFSGHYVQVIDRLLKQQGIANQDDESN